MLKRIKKRGENFDWGFDEPVFNAFGWHPFPTEITRGVQI
jgi:hypothetical protein